jgi:predicted Zn-dependent protease
MRRVPAILLVLALAGCGGRMDVGSVMSAAQTMITQGPGAVTGAFADMDEPQEIELGRAVTANVGSRYKLLRDPALTRYVAQVGNVVAARSERPDLRYYFAVLDAPEVNAFAAPGGYVFITRGSLTLMRDEAMLAGVLGHEVAHVALRHGVEAIKAQKRKDLAVLGLQQGLRFTSAAPFTQAISLAADTVAEQIVLKGFSRAEEEEADRAGFQYARAAGYDPAGLRDFLAALVQRGAGDTRTATFFSTHPGTEDRMKEQEKLLAAAAGRGQRNPDRFAKAVASR